MTLKRQDALLDRVISHMNLKNDAAVSRLLGVPPPVVSKTRSGKIGLGAVMILNIHESTGLPIKEIKELLA